MLQEAQLPQTEQSAGKKERRVALRSKDSKQEKTRQPWHCKVRVLLLGRTSKRKRDDEAAQHPKWFPQYLNSQKEKKVWGRGGCGSGRTVSAGAAAMLQTVAIQCACYRSGEDRCAATHTIHRATLVTATKSGRKGAQASHHRVPQQVKRWKAATAASMRVAARQTAEAAAAAAVAATAAVQ